METINQRWVDIYGYKPSIHELYNYYSSGSLMQGGWAVTQTDEEEDQLIAELERVGIF